MKNLIFIFIVLFFCVVTQADVLIYIPEDIVYYNDHYIEIPVHISNIGNYKIGGYMIRLEYDDLVLLNPEIITTGTLSEGLSVESATPVDNFGGQLTIALFNGLSVTKDGLLIKIRLTPADSFIASKFKFIPIKTGFHSNSFDSIPTKSSVDAMLIKSANENFQIISFDLNYTNNFSGIIDGKVFAENENIVFSNLSPINSLVFAGHNDLPLKTIIPIDESDNTQILHTAWCIKSNPNLSYLDISFKVNDNTFNSNNYYLTRSDDNIIYSEIAKASYIDSNNNMVVFELNNEQLQLPAYFKIKIKDYLTQPPDELKQKFFAINKKDFVLLSWHYNNEDQILGFNIWKKNPEQSYYFKINSSIIPFELNKDIYSFKDYDMLENINYMYKLEYIFKSSSFMLEKESNFLKYDLNKDFKFDIKDALILLQHLSIIHRFK